MCGIAGIVDLRGTRDIDRGAVARMAASLKHRGPDGEGFHFAPGVGLGHRRLAIIDFAGGAQPFLTADRRGALTFNGEIYNYQALAAELSGAGVPLRTRSDTEALAEGLAREGASFVRQLRGMFAFGYWDQPNETLLLARDRLGERPLYYAESPEGFLVFASEIQAIAASGLLRLEIDHEALADYLLYGYVPDPKSIYKRVRKLPPASLLTCRRGEKPKLETYWAPAFGMGAEASFDAAAETLAGLIDEAVRLQMISDAPLGAFLSGGVDSAAVVASMARAGGAVKTCTVGFEDDAYDERAFAAETAALFKTDHSEEVASIDAASLIDDVARAYGEPFADTSALPSYIVAKLARRHVTVALSGDGGDELFLGYRRYALFEREERVRRAAPQLLRTPLFAAAGALYPKLDWAPKPLRLKTTFQSLSEDTKTAYAHATAANRPDRIEQMITRDFKRSLDGYDPASVVRNAMTLDDAPPLMAAQQADLATWLPGRMLVKVDRASMAHSLEVRPPLLDHKLVEWACRLDPAFKSVGGENKRVLKAALAPRLPEAILTRKKRGFGLPVADWLRAADGPLDRLTTSQRWRDSGVIDPLAVETMIARHRSRVSDYSQELWTVVMYDAFLAASPRRGAPF